MEADTSEPAKPVPWSWLASDVPREREAPRDAIRGEPRVRILARGIPSVSGRHRVIYPFSEDS